MLLSTLLGMASHFSMVGFVLREGSAATMGEDVSAYVQLCDPIQLAGNDYLCVVRYKSGAELWVGLKRTNDETVEITTVNPALAGEGVMKVVVDGDVSDAEWRPFEIAVQAHFGEYEVPLVFDLADPREADRFSPGAPVTIDLTAFADEISVHESEATYHQSQDGREVKFASNHFIPSGMFADGTESKRPTAHAIFAGRILKSELRQNETGKGRYWWFLVETMDKAIVNVLADPETVLVTPKVGGYLSGSFWLSARLSK